MKFISHKKHTSKVDTAGGFNKCIHHELNKISCLSITPTKFSRPCSQPLPLTGNHRPDFFYYRSTLSVLELYIGGTIQYALNGILLNGMLLRFFQFVACISSSFFCIAKLESIAWLLYNRLYPLTWWFHLGLIMNKAAVKTNVHLFWVYA